MRLCHKWYIKFLKQSKNMKDYDKHREIELLRKLFVLTAKRSMRPSMTDNVAMRLIFEELHLLTDKDEYRL